MKTVYDYIKDEESNYKTVKIPVAEGYEWNMYEHIRKSTLYRDSKFTEGPDDGSRPFKNIIRRIRNMQVAITGFNVTEIEPFVNDADNYYKSFLVRKYHPKWARRYDMDTFIDKTVESYVDYGLALSKHKNKQCPEDVPLASIAFCDQTDILSGPICLKHNYSPAQLHEFDGKWKNIDEVITLARKDKVDKDGRTIKTPGKFIEVYELDGMFPVAWLKEPQDITEDDYKSFSQQLHIVTFYKDNDGNKQGIALYKGKGDPEKYKAVKRDDIWGRACGFGAIEELFEDQVWTNYNMIRLQGLLDSASKSIGLTDDPGVAARYKPSDMENGEWIVHASGKSVGILNNQPINIQLFENAVAQWENHAQGLSSANDALLGESPSAGTPFKLQELLTNQGATPHDYRRGKIATYISEVYRDWALQDLVDEMNKEQEFMDELSLEELQYCIDRIEVYEANKMLDEMALNGEEIYPDIKEEYKKKVREDFMKSGGKKFFSLLKDELKELPMDVFVNVDGKQKNLSQMTDKLTNIFRTVIANPAVLSNPPIAKIFNMILESSGLSEVDFSGLTKAGVAPEVQGAVPPGAAPTSPAQQQMPVA